MLAKQKETLPYMTYLQYEGRVKSNTSSDAEKLKKTPLKECQVSDKAMNTFKEPLNNHFMLNNFPLSTECLMEQPMLNTLSGKCFLEAGKIG